MSRFAAEAAQLLERLGEAPAGQRLELVRGIGPEEDVLIALGDEAERLAVVEVRRAIAASQLVTTLADEARLPRARARARRAQAQALSPAGEFEGALELCREAAAIAFEAGLGVEAARALLASLAPLAHLGRFSDAVEAGEAARADFVTAGEPKLAARADLNLGAVHRMRDSQSQALFHYERAREALLDEPEILAQLDSNRGTALMYLDDFDGAEAAYQSAAEAFRKTEMNTGAAIVEGNLADLATRQGRLGRALTHFERARRHLERDYTPGHSARLVAEQADALAETGLWEDALRGYEESIADLDDHGLTQWAARARAGKGRVLIRLGRLDEAETTFEESAAAFEELGHRTSRAQVELAQADLLMDRGRREESKRHLEDALQAFDRRPAQAAMARHRLARIALAEGNLEMTRALLDEALEGARRLDLAPLLADLLHLTGLMRRQQGDDSEALESLRAAIAEVERLRGSLQAERFRTAFLGDRVAVYEDFASLALERGVDELAEAFRAVEFAKSRALLDRVSGALDLEEVAEREGVDQAETELLSELAALRARLNWHYSRLSAEAREEESIPEESGWATNVHECERRLEELEDRLAVSRGVAGLYARPAKLEDVQRRLGEREALLEYFLMKDELLAFVVKRDCVTVHRGLDEFQQMIGRIQRVQFQIQRGIRSATSPTSSPEKLVEQARRELRELWARLWAPLEEDLQGIDRIIVVPHGPLHAVPFHALWNGRSHLIDVHEISFAPSASVWAQLAEVPEEAPSDSRPLVVGVPDEIAPGIDREAREVAEELGAARLLLDSEATRSNVLDAARGARVLHLACHGRFLPSRPLASGLKLADGWLTVREVYSLRLEPGLVILSGCETGGNVVDTGDELVGLMRGFFTAGMRSIVVSLWTVNDESAVELMSNFYRSIRSGLGVGAALRSAQRETLSSRPHPAFWAPFILGGGS